MDPCNLYTWNPLALPFLNGFEAEEIGTPPGHTDLYSEFNYDVSLVPGELRLKDRVSFDADFLVLGTIVWSDQPAGEIIWNARFRGIDGDAIQNTRIAGNLLGGSRGNPKPWIHPEWVPLGKTIGIEIGLPGAAVTSPVRVQITFCGLRRWKVRG